MFTRTQLKDGNKLNNFDKSGFSLPLLLTSTILRETDRERDPNIRERSFPGWDTPANWKNIVLSWRHSLSTFFVSTLCSTPVSALQWVDRQTSKPVITLGDDMPCDIDGSTGCSWTYVELQHPGHRLKISEKQLVLHPSIDACWQQFKTQINVIRGKAELFLDLFYFSPSLILFPFLNTCRVTLPSLFQFLKPLKVWIQSVWEHRPPNLVV